MTDSVNTIEWLTLALVVVRGFYAWATYRILRANEHVVAAMRDQTEAQTRPCIFAYVSTRIGTTLLHLTIENAGKSAALELRLTMDKSFFQNGQSGGVDISKHPAFTEPIAAGWPSPVRSWYRAFVVLRCSQRKVSETLHDHGQVSIWDSRVRRRECHRSPASIWSDGNPGSNCR